MKGDFSRDTFDRRKHFSRVLVQQGRVTLDADYNEQSSIVLHYLRALARDLIGPYAAPVENGGFLLTVDAENGGVRISGGRYYVDGILVENEEECGYEQQPDYSLGKDDPYLAEMKNPSGLEFWFYLDVWEQHITALEDDSIRESALGGPDTCTRAKVVWQVKALPMAKPADDLAKKIRALRARRAKLQLELKKTEDPEARKRLTNEIAKIDAEIKKLSDAAAEQKEIACDAPLAQLVALSAASLAARVDPGKKVEDACIIPPASKYRGAENQLYRVEIHEGGKAGEATFKWSRDNGSGETAWLGTSKDKDDLIVTLTVANTRGFAAGDWIELVNNTLDAHGATGTLVRLANVEGGNLSVDPESVPGPDALAWSEELDNPRVRRWNQIQTEDVVLKSGAVPIAEPSATFDGWIDLEDGVQIQFAAGGVYRSGDYWLIPAPFATGKIEWPQIEDANGKPTGKPLPPRGVAHHYAPLGFVSRVDESWSLRTCRCEIEPLSSCFSMGSVGVGEHLLTEVRFQPAPVAKPTKKRKRRKRSPN